MTVSTAAITFVDFPSDKAILAGNCGVGKTTLFLWFREGRYVEDVRSVRMDGEWQKTWEDEGEQLSLTLFDTAGMECHNPRARLNSTYFRRSKVIIFVYDITNRESFDSLSHWEDEALQKTVTRNNTDILMALVGNKLDLAEDDRQVTRSRALQFAENFFIPKHLVFEVSAKTGEGVEEMFNAIGQAMIGRGQNSKSSKPSKRRGGSGGRGGGGGGCKC